MLKSERKVGRIWRLGKMSSITRRGAAAAAAGGRFSDEKETKAAGNLKNSEMKDGKSKADTRRQGTMDNAFRRVAFEDEERYNVLKDKIKEELGKVRQERVEIEKLKVDLQAREVETLERLERIEAQFRELTERDRVREARLDALEERIYYAPGEGDTGFLR